MNSVYFCQERHQLTIFNNVLYRENILNEVLEWLSIASMMFSGQSFQLAELSLEKRMDEGDEAIQEAHIAMKKALQCIDKIKNIGKVIFEDLESPGSK